MLYRHFLVACKDKPVQTKLIVQNEFRENAKIERTDTIKIDYLLRRGRKQLKILQLADSIKTI